MIGKKEEKGLRLTRFQRLKLALFNHVYVGHQIRAGWKGALPFYAFLCATHGLVENYPMGYARRLLCPFCLKEDYECSG